MQHRRVGVAYQRFFRQVQVSFVAKLIFFSYCNYSCNCQPMQFLYMFCGVLPSSLLKLLQWIRHKFVFFSSSTQQNSLVVSKASCTSYRLMISEFFCFVWVHWQMTRFALKAFSFEAFKRRFLVMIVIMTLWVTSVEAFRQSWTK